MEPDILPFQIGLEYEDLEFDLEILPDRIAGYDSYIFVGKELKNFLNNPTKKIELIFSWDIMTVVIISLDSKETGVHLHLSKYFNLVEKNENYISCTNNEISIIALDGLVVYGKPTEVSIILSILLC